MKKIIFIITICILIFTGCANITNNKSKNKENNSLSQNKDTKESETKMSNISIIKVTINNKTYNLKLENNKTVEEFIKLLPQEYNMTELNENEKYVYINTSLPTNSNNLKKIEKGDVMLYGDNCLVLFYQSFETQYQYTKIGHIEDLENIGLEDIKVKFEK